MGKYYGMIWAYGNSLAHYGIKGQKWGIRRFQYENGSYTPEGKERYGRGSKTGGSQKGLTRGFFFKPKPEPKRRYQNDDGTLTEEGKRRYGSEHKQVEIYNKATERFNNELRNINQKYDKVDLDDDSENLRYTQDIRDAWVKNYYDVLAEDIESDPDTLKGQKWIDEMKFSHKLVTDQLDAEIESIKQQIKDKAESEKRMKSYKERWKSNNVTEKYANKKMEASEAFERAYDDLEKLHSNFYDLPQDLQDELFWEYLNESGLYRWV